MLLSRTREKIAYHAKLAIFNAGGFQQVLDERERRTLEDHMGFRGQWNEHRRFQLEFAKTHGLRKTSRLIEFGCGPLTLGLPAIAYLDANRYIGVDVRAEVLNLGWAQVAKAGLAGKNPRLIHSASFGADEMPDAQCDVLWSFSVLYHLTDELVAQCFEQVSRRLAAGGAYFANINPRQEESTWLQFPFNRRDVSFYRSIAEHHGLRAHELGTLESLGFRLDSIEKVNILLRFERA